jgi:hypothetical protein
MKMHARLAISAGIVLFTRSAASQVVTLDQGSFTITINGERSGREEFKILSTPSPTGATMKAMATVVLNDRRLTPRMDTDSGGVPLMYQVEVKAGAETQEKLNGTISRGRISVQSQNPRGESRREYVVAEGALILDDDVFHQYYFVARQGKRGSIPVVVPRRNTQLMFKVTSAGTDRVSVGNASLDADKLTITEPGGAEREVWVDKSSRVLKVSIPSRGLIAIRDDPPK